MIITMVMVAVVVVAAYLILSTGASQPQPYKLDVEPLAIPRSEQPSQVD